MVVFKSEKCAENPFVFNRYFLKTTNSALLLNKGHGPILNRSMPSTAGATMSNPAFL
jgi:hypothetical protein